MKPRAPETATPAQVETLKQIQRIVRSARSLEARAELRPIEHACNVMSGHAHLAIAQVKDLLKTIAPTDAEAKRAAATVESVVTGKQAPAPEQTESPKPERKTSRDRLERTAPKRADGGDEAA